MGKSYYNRKPNLVAQLVRNWEPPPRLAKQQGNGDFDARSVPSCIFSNRGKKEQKLIALRSRAKEGSHVWPFSGK